MHIPAVHPLARCCQSSILQQVITLLKLIPLPFPEEEDPLLTAVHLPLCMNTFLISQLILRSMRLCAQCVGVLTSVKKKTVYVRTNFFVATK